MKLFILFTTFLYTFVLSPQNVFGQETANEDCPFVLYHLIKEGNARHFTYTFSAIELWLEYGADPNPDLEKECFDPYYQSLPQGSTLIHVLGYSHLSSIQKFQVYNLMTENGATVTLDENNETLVCHVDHFGGRQHAPVSCHVGQEGSHNPLSNLFIR